MLSHLMVVAVFESGEKQQEQKLFVLVCLFVGLSRGTEFSAQWNEKLGRILFIFVVYGKVICFYGSKQ